MKIATWNINSIKARQPLVEKWIKAAKPDVLLLQELKGEAFPEKDFEALGYKALIKGQKTYNGVAMLVKKELDAKLIHDALPGDKKDEQARYLEAEIEGVRLINIYAPNGNPMGTDKFTYKLSWMDRLIKRVKDLRAEEIPFAIGGDYNIIPTAKDVYNVKDFQNDAQYALESRKKYRTLVNLGLTDSFRAVNSAAGEYTFWDYQAGAWPRNHGMRIDYFLLAPALADRLKSCTIDKEPRGWERPSDHVPVTIELKP